MGVFADIGHLWRLTHVGWVLATEGALAPVPVSALPVFARLPMKLAKGLARRHTSGALATAVARLGPSYVKLGQFLATRPDIAGHRLAKELSSLQDKMLPFSQAEAIASITGIPNPSTRLGNTNACAC